MAENTTAIETAREPAGGRPGRGWLLLKIERSRLFLSEVRNELKRVTWPSQKEVYATTVVVILTSAFFGLYLFVLDFGLLRLVQWIFRIFGVAGPTA
ncbi:MAG: preprotein translocase subunit SecE [Acidobacteria bacterium]|nr:preprotein translocase subunit SecE [Acidobacteriota bacterium]